ncbi:ABC transporter ATP-binding protein [Paenibacillus sp. GCM10028914]|uniref:ABC transporter ATP-binding protein n=1 Tax=Paenibacillus sp. GCM10028914 TaxID=3273416 RepID=UPI003613481C
MTNLVEVIEFKKVTKTFSEAERIHSSLKEKFTNLFKENTRQIYRKHKVLADISFTIKEGTTTGIIGENGNGKSTILKLISNIYEPDDGEVQVIGKVASLLEIGVGFQPDLTGKENIYLYGSILGLSKQQIRQKYEEIVAFSELVGFMDTPVKHYSSGMYMRLAFSVAIHVDPDIVLIDEVLAVGDEIFQKKCMSKIDELQKKGKTILFVSHDLNVVRRICDKVIYLKKDGSIEYGDTDKIVNLYLANIYQKDIKSSIIDTSVSNDTNRWGTKSLEITNVKFLNSTTGKERNVFVTNDDIVISLSVKRNDLLVNKAVVGCAFFSKGIGEPVYLVDRNSFLDSKLLDLSDEENDISIKFTAKNIPFLSGEYLVSVVVYDETCQIPFDHQHQYYRLEIINNREQMPSLVHVEFDWEF